MLVTENVLAAGGISACWRRAAWPAWGLCQAVERAVEISPEVYGGGSGPVGDAGAVVF